VTRHILGKENAETGGQKLQSRGTKRRCCTDTNERQNRCQKKKQSAQTHHQKHQENLQSADCNKNGGNTKKSAHIKWLKSTKCKSLIKTVRKYSLDETKSWILVLKFRSFGHEVA